MTELPRRSPLASPCSISCVEPAERGAGRRHFQGRARQGQARPGFTLLEVAAVLVVMALLFTIITSLIVSSVRIEQAEATAFQRSVAIATLADQFRADVHAAERTAGNLDRFSAGPECLILEQGRGEAVIYRWTGGQLNRIHKRAGEVTYQALPVPEGFHVEIASSTNDSSMAEISLHPEKPSPGRRPLHIRAALGGNRR